MTVAELIYALQQHDAQKPVRICGPERMPIDSEEKWEDDWIWHAKVVISPETPEGWYDHKVPDALFIYGIGGL